MYGPFSVDLKHTELPTVPISKGQSLQTGACPYETHNFSIVVPTV